MYSGVATQGDNTDEDYSDWMKSLPQSLCSMPLNHLAIPGMQSTVWSARCIFISAEQYVSVSYLYWLWHMLIKIL